MGDTCKIYATEGQGVMKGAGKGGEGRSVVREDR
jgi:hypothetical protein